MNRFLTRIGIYEPRKRFNWPIFCLGGVVCVGLGYELVVDPANRHDLWAAIEAAIVVALLAFAAYRYARYKFSRLDTSPYIAGTVGFVIGTKGLIESLQTHDRLRAILAVCVGYVLMPLLAYVIDRYRRHRFLVQKHS